MFIDIDANEPETLTIKYEVSLRVQALEQLISQKKACYHFKVECGDTFYSDTFVSETPNGDFTCRLTYLRIKLKPVATS